ncbi:MAG: FHA domain-containing protein, partial [Lentisphaeria bacterium]|nr:FHA domain-containing protein [Lentisphaeria bacterium]
RKPLKPGGTTIGRALESDIRLGHGSVSRNHAEIRMQGERWLIRDMGSSNGTRSNGRLVSELELADGDRLHFGDVAVRVLRQDGEAVDLRDDPREYRTQAIPDSSIVLSAAEVSQSKGHRHDSVLGSSGAPPTVEMLAALVTVAREMLRTTELDALLERIADQVFRYIPVEDVFLLLYESGTDELIPKVTRTREGGAPDTTISSSIVRRSYQEGESILTEDAQADPRFAAGPSVISQGIRSVMCVPMLGEMRPLGVIFVDCRTRRVTLREYHLHFLTLLAGVGATALEQAGLRAAISREAAMKERLMRYHSPTLVDELLASPGGTARLEPTEREVSVLFADMVGFSTRTEHMRPKEVALLLNRFLSALVETIFEFGGTLDKFIGDAAMAIFGAPNDQADHAERAVRCALNMQEAVAKLNAEYGLQQQPITVRIGINSGMAVSGDIGSSRRMEYTVLGNTVNVASRLESHVAGPGQIVIGEGTREALGDALSCEDLGPQVLKGMHTTVRAYRVLPAE